MVVRALGKHGVCRRRELVDLLGRYRVQAAIKRGELIQLWAGIVADGDVADSIITRAAGALLVAGPSAAITGPTAAHLHGCTALDGNPVHVIVPYEHWLRSRPGLVVHNGRGFEADVTEFDGLQVLGLEYVLTDLLCIARPGDALAVVDQALALALPADRESLRQRLYARLTRRDDPRGTVRGARILELATGRAASPAESRLLWVLIEAGLPTPEINWPVLDIDGREIYRIDAAWVELRVAVEYNGYAAHHGREAADEARKADLERRGWIVIPASAVDLRDPSQLIARVRQAFARRGCA
jgi:hypothetical protein